MWFQNADGGCKMNDTRFWGILILAITFLIVAAYFLRKQNSFLNIREIVCDYWKMLSSFRHRVVFMATPISFGIGLALIAPITVSVLETICTAISILLGLLFATLGAIAGGNGQKEKVRPQTYSVVFNETINTILYLSCLSIADLMALFMGLALVPLYETLQQFCMGMLRLGGSVIVYALTFCIFLNCLIVIKRIARLMEK